MISITQAVPVCAVLRRRLLRLIRRFIPLVENRLSHTPTGLGAALCEDFFRYCVCDTKSVAEKRLCVST